MRLRLGTPPWVWRLDLQGTPTTGLLKVQGLPDKGEIVDISTRSAIRCVEMESVPQCLRLFFPAVFGNEHIRVMVNSLHQTTSRL